MTARRARDADATSVVVPVSVPDSHGRVVFALACLVCLAGCNAVAVDDTPGNRTATLTPAPVPTGDAAPRPPPVETLPPGLSADGRLRADRLARGHVTALGDTSYTWTLAVTETQVDTPTTVWQSTRRVAVGPNATFVERTGSPPVEELGLYGTDGMWYERRASGDATAAVARPSRGWVHSFARTAVSQYLAGVRYDVTAITRSGQRFYRLTAFVDGPHRVETRRGQLRVWNYAVTAFVAPSGFVQQFVVEYDRRVGASRHHVYVWFGYAALGTTTVDRPAWAPPTATATETRTVTSSSTATRTGTASTRPNGTRTGTASTRPNGTRTEVERTVPGDTTPSNATSRAVATAADAVANRSG